jgi:hypothetical protein
MCRTRALHAPEIAKVAEQEPKQAVEPAEKLSTMAEHNRHLGPLNEACTPQEAQQFGWKRETGSIQCYQHSETGRQVHIDGADGQFYDRDREPISAKEGLLSPFVPPHNGHRETPDTITTPAISFARRRAGLRYANP